MASPSQTEIETQLKNACAYLEAVRIRGAVTSTYNVGALLDTFVQSLEGEFAGSALAAAEVLRGAYASALTPARVQAILGPLLREEGRRIGSPLTNLYSLLAPGVGSIYRDFIDNDRRLVSKSPTFGSVSAGGSNVGDGTMLRCTVDAEGQTLEGYYSPKDTPVTAECVQDANSGATRGEEVFRLYGRPQGRDAIDERGSGADLTVASASSNATQAVLNNPSFSQVTPTTNDATVTNLPGWDVTTSIGNFETVSDDTYRPLGSETTARAIRFTADDTLTSANRLRGINRTRPYVVQIAFKRESSCDGTLTLSVGAQSEAVTLSAQSGWTVLRMTIGTKCWPQNWDQNDVKLSIALSSNTTGTLLIDDVVVVPMVAHDGLYYMPVGGATRFLIGDTFTFSDSETGAIVQRWISRGWPGRYLPAVPDATQVTASGGRTLTFATAGDTITASTGDFAADGYEAGMLLTVAGTSSNDGTYTITNVTATVITVSENLTNEGPLSSTATLDATASITDPTVS